MRAEMSVKLRVIVKRAGRSEERVAVKSEEKEREKLFGEELAALTIYWTSSNPVAVDLIHCWG